VVKAGNGWRGSTEWDRRVDEVKLTWPSVPPRSPRPPESPRPACCRFARARAAAHTVRAPTPPHVVHAAHIAHAAHAAHGTHEAPGAHAACAPQVLQAPKKSRVRRRYRPRTSTRPGVCLHLSYTSWVTKVPVPINIIIITN
jgi:hypothetical protein